jgi:hypothetical protein
METFHSAVMLYENLEIFEKYHLSYKTFPPVYFNSTKRKKKEKLTNSHV